MVPPTLAQATASGAPFATFTARLATGSLGASTLVVKYPVPDDTSFPRKLYATYPYPIYTGGIAEFGVVLANGGDAMTIDKVDLDIPGGYDLANNSGLGAPLFPTGALLEDASGVADGSWHHVDDRHVQWTPNDPTKPRSLAADSTSFWVVRAQVTSDPQFTTDIEPWVSSGPEARVAFPENGVSVASREWGASPGIIRVEAQPGSAGYPWTNSVATHPMQSRVQVFPSTLVKNDSATYDVVPNDVDALSFQRAAQNSTFEVENRSVRLGGSARLHGDMSSLVSALNAKGISQGALSIDTYAPPSLGCHPTSHVAAELGSLPHAPIEDAWLWGDDGIPSILAGSDDSNVYRVSTAGVPIWTYASRSIPLALMPVRVGASSYVFVADAGGLVSALDATTGQRLWQAPVGTHDAPDSAVSDAAPVLAFDAARQRIAVGAGVGGGTFTAFGLDGARAVAPVMMGSPVLQLECAPEGCLALSATSLARVDAGGGAVTSSHTAAKGFALGPDIIFVLDGDRVSRVDRASLALGPGPVYSSPSPTILASAGDATGDGVEDLLVAATDLSVAVIDGAGGSLAWSVQAPGMIDRALRTCTDAELFVGGTYATDICHDPGTQSRPTILLLAASQGRTFYAFNRDGATKLAGFDAAGMTKFLTNLDAPASKLCGHFGTWLASPAFLLGRDDGVVDVRDATSGDQKARQDLSSFAGVFEAVIRIPDGGFFGTHVAIATLSWVDAQGAAQSAKLVDWFEVLDVDGLPVAHPSYRLVVVARDPSAPDRSS